MRGKSIKLENFDVRFWCFWQDLSYNCTMKFLIISSLGSAFFFLIGFAGSVFNFVIGDDAISQSTILIKKNYSDKFPDLYEDARDLIVSESALASAILKEKGNRKVIIDTPSFTESGNFVVARISFYDGMAPRKVTMFVDGYNASSQLVASFPYEFESTGVNQDISVKVINPQYVSRFEIRFMQGTNLIQSMNSDANFPRVVPVNPDAMLFHSDYPELRKLLDGLGYMNSKSFEPAAMFGAVRRFRIDYGMDGPDFVTLRDLFALRIVSKSTSSTVQLLPYIEWSSGSEGGWMESREEFKEESDDDLPAGISNSSEDVFEGMDPAAEEDNSYE